MPRAGFEPTSLPREGNMLDRATLPGLLRDAPIAVWIKTCQLRAQLRLVRGVILSVVRPAPPCPRPVRPGLQTSETAHNLERDFGAGMTPLLRYGGRRKSGGLRTPRLHDSVKD